MAGIPPDSRLPEQTLRIRIIGPLLSLEVVRLNVGFALGSRRTDRCCQFRSWGNSHRYGPRDSSRLAAHGRRLGGAIGEAGPLRLANEMTVDLN